MEKERKECSLENEEERNLMLRKDGAVLSVTTVEWRKKKAKRRRRDKPSSRNL